MRNQHYPAPPARGRRCLSPFFNRLLERIGKRASGRLAGYLPARRASRADHQASKSA